MNNGNPDDSKTNVVERLHANGEPGAYRRVTAYAKQKGYGENSEMWVWADILGFSAQLVDDVPLKVRNAGKEVAEGLAEACKTQLQSAIGTGQQVTEELGKLCKDIETATNGTIIEHRRALEQQAATTSNELVGKVSEKLLGTVDQVAKAHANASFLRGVVVAAVALLVVAAAGAGGGWYLAKMDYADKLRAATNVPNAAEAEAGLKLARLGQARLLVECRSAGWEKKQVSPISRETMCQPVPTPRGNVAGWYVDNGQ